MLTDTEHGTSSQTELMGVTVTYALDSEKSQYVTIGIESDEDLLDLTVAYGPFDTLDGASEFGTRNFQFSWVCEIVDPERINEDDET